MTGRGPVPGTTPTPGDDQRTAAVAALAGFPTSRAIAWSMLGGEVRRRAVRVLVDEQGLDGYAAVAAFTHALRSDTSPWAGDVDRAIGRALSESLREAFAPFVAVARTLFDGYAGALRAWGPIVADVERPCTPVWQMQGLDGRRRRR